MDSDPGYHNGSVPKDFKIAGIQIRNSTFYMSTSLQSSEKAFSWSLNRCVQITIKGMNAIEKVVCLSQFNFTNVVCVSSDEVRGGSRTAWRDDRPAPI